MDIRRYALFLEDWFDEAFVEGAFSNLLCSMEFYFIYGGEMYKIFAKVMANRLYKSLLVIIHSA